MKALLDKLYSKNSGASGTLVIKPAEIVSFLLLLTGLLLDNYISAKWFVGSTRLGWYILAYLLVAVPILVKGVQLAFRGEIFTEFTLMGIATIGAFLIGDYPEGVAVMLFYAIGESFQAAAVRRAKFNIKKLIDVRPSVASVLRDGKYVSVNANDVHVGESILVKAGERVALDGVMTSEKSSFNTSALTGESKPRSIYKGETVLAGMINESQVIEMKTTRLFDDSSLSRILKLVENAQGRKAKTELFIRRFAKVYTPIVVALAAALIFVPYFFVSDYHFSTWLYRGLIFLVISCPCALVVAIPLGYFGGIGAGSRNGILFKGSTYLDRMTRVGTVVMDKTGTLTTGVFKVQNVSSNGLGDREMLSYLAAVEAHSTHPIAKAIVAHAGAVQRRAERVEELKGLGLRGTVDGHEVLAGNKKLLEKFGIASEAHSGGGTLVAVAIDKKLAGYITISDELKEDSHRAVQELHALNIETVVLSGDHAAVVDGIAKKLNIKTAYGNLLPEEKVEKFQEIKKTRQHAVAFVGDGINDAPVLALSDVGIAMGGLGTDAAIETADVVIQNDQPSKILTAIKIGKATNSIVWQNISLAFGVKILVLTLGAFGIASMWGAVFADVGVALLAILNAIRIQRMRF